MAAYLITYDLNSTGQKYNDVIDAIKSSSQSWYSNWKSSYLVKSNLSVSDFMSKIEPHLDSNDRLIIIEVKNNCSGWLLDEDWQWIREEILD